MCSCLIVTLIEERKWKLETGERTTAAGTQQQQQKIGREKMTVQFDSGKQINSTRSSPFVSA